jgi:putative ABC transport system permease protein
MLDWHVLTFTLLISLFTGILFGLVPAFSASRADVSTTLNESGSRSGAGLRQNKTRSILIVTEMALALVLLAGAGLLIRTFMALRTVDPGFDAHDVLAMEMSLAETRFAKTTAIADLLRNAEQRVSSIPGVAALATTNTLPLEPWGFLPFTIEGRPLTDGPYHGGANWRNVSPGYFDVFRIPLRRGRMFTDRDDYRAPGVVLVNEAMAKQFWPHSDPVGERIEIGKGVGPEFEEAPRQIIGVVADVRETGLNNNPEPVMYIPIVQLTDSLTALNNKVISTTWVIRTKTEPYSLSADIQRELRVASGGLPVAHIRSMEQVTVESTARTNFNMKLLSIFAGVALFLAAIGIYGLMAYSVQQRTHEIGIRMALGARAGSVLLLVLREGLGLALVGIALGVLGAAWLTQAIKSLLFRVNPNDPLTFALVGALLLFVAAAATYVPARRATKVDPIVALRYE